MPQRLSLTVSDDVMAAARERAEQLGVTLAQVLRDALGEAFDVDHRSLFQVSTSGALVEGVYQGCVSVGTLRAHGDFGLGTFEGLDGELVMLDGHCFQSRGDGLVSEARDEALTPFAVVTHFRAERESSVGQVGTLADLEAHIDADRPSANLFVGVRAHGTFDRLVLRAACRTEHGTSLVEATANQREWSLAGVTGTLVGFWSPPYSRAVSVAGHHLHFLSDDRQQAGHVLDLSAAHLVVQQHDVHDVHVALPESTAFLRADLAGDNEAALDVVERGVGRGSTS